jgi:hypothetical protein
MWLWHAALPSTTTSIEKRIRRVNTLTEAITPIAKQAASVSCTEKLSFWIQGCFQNRRCSPLCVSDGSFLPTHLLDVGDPQSKLESISPYLHLRALLEKRCQVYSFKSLLGKYNIKVYNYHFRHTGCSLTGNFGSKSDK